MPRHGMSLIECEEIKEARVAQGKAAAVTAPVTVAASPASTTKHRSDVSSDAMNESFFLCPLCSSSIFGSEILSGAPAISCPCCYTYLTIDQLIPTDDAGDVKEDFDGTP